MKKNSSIAAGFRFAILFVLIVTTAAVTVSSQVVKALPKSRSDRFVPSSVFVSSFTEDFEAVTFPPTSGGGAWTNRNLSVSAGTAVFPNCWDTISNTEADAATIPLFHAQSGVQYIEANFQCTGSASTTAATLSAWLISPQITFNNGDQIKFWTRTVDASAFPDRLELRLGVPAVAPLPAATPNTGATATTVGDFTTVLVSVNPTLAVGGYPETYTQFTGTISGLGAQTTGWFAFRYFVTAGGPNGANSNFIGVDNLQYINATTAAAVSVAGRVTTPDGRGITNAIVTISDPSGRSTSIVTGRNGAFSFPDIETGSTYIITVASRRFSFSPKAVTVTDSVADLVFTPDGSQ